MSIVLLFTGGTISMRHDAAVGGAVPTLRGPDIVKLVPGIDKLADIEVDDWAAHPGPHMTLARMWELRARIIRHLERPDVDGVVVTHGTDALEETAYLLARSTASDKPVVVTGAKAPTSLIVIVLIPCLVAMMRFIHHEYAETTRQLALRPDQVIEPPHRRERVIVPDPNIEPAGCVIEAGSMKVDAQLGPALARAKRALLGEGGMQ